MPHTDEVFVDTLSDFLADLENILFSCFEQLRLVDLKYFVC